MVTFGLNYLNNLTFKPELNKGIPNSMIFQIILKCNFLLNQVHSVFRNVINLYLCSQFPVPAACFALTSLGCGEALAVNRAWLPEELLVNLLQII